MTLLRTKSPRPILMFPPDTDKVDKVLVQKLFNQTETFNTTDWGSVKGCVGVERLSTAPENLEGTELERPSKKVWAYMPTSDTVK